MILSFKCKDIERLFNDEFVRKFFSIQRQARRKLLILESITKLETLLVPPANRLEKLNGSRKDQYSIRVNDQWRICFRFYNRNVFDVEIIDYH